MSRSLDGNSQDRAPESISDLNMQYSESRKRKSRTDEASSSRKRFHYLKARTRHIPQNTITSKWAPLPLPAQQRVRELLRSVKRPVVLQRGRHDERRRNEIEMALSAVVRKMENQLPRMPFPPGTREWAFDLEHVLERNRQFENDLTPAMHSAELLRTEIEKEELALERDRALLARLEANAKAEEKMRKKHITKTHALLETTYDADAGDDAQSINLAPSTTLAETASGEPDEELVPILSQLRGHLDSMHANSGQLTGVDQAMRRAQAALDGLLYRRAGKDIYDASITP